MIRWLLCKIGLHKYPRHGGRIPPGYPRFGACRCGRLHPENRRKT